MKRIIVGLVSLCFLVGIEAASIDGRSSAVYATWHRVFNDGNTVQGFVDLGKGFTVVPVASGAGSTHGANMFMDTCVTVSSAIDLRGTNTMTLLRNLYLDDGVTFSDSGKIYSYGNALVMKGDLSIPADKVLHCGGKLIIDGNGYTLNFASGAQIFLDNSSTLTLRNMVIKTVHTYPGQPALNISSSMSRLTLDNVMLSLGDDLYVNRGQVFFHNDVVVTGTSALVYRSIAPSYIASHGSLLFDHGTTFSYAPAVDNKDLFVLSDASSTLAFDGSSLLATHTGLRLTKGRLYFDDKVTLNSKSDVYINTTTPCGTSISEGAGSSPYALSWAPDGKYVAVISHTTSPNTLRVFSFSGNALTSVATASITGNWGGTVSWSPDGKHIALNGGATGLQIYTFNGSSLAQVGTTVTTGASYGIAWSPDGRYVAVEGYGASGPLKIFSFAGSTPVQVGGNVSTGAYSSSVAWAPNGKYLAVASPNSKKLQVFSFADSTPVQVGSDVIETTALSSVDWSPDGSCLAVTNNGGQKLNIYHFSGSTPDNKVEGTTSTTSPTSVYWSPNGCYLAVVEDSIVEIFSFFKKDTNQCAPVSIGTKSVTSAYALKWAPDGKYIAVVDNSANLFVFPINYLTDTSTQPMDHGIIFGNSSLGPTYDLEVHVDSGAAIEINGNVLHDAA